jgi:hypothetical protein
MQDLWSLHARENRFVFLRPYKDRGDDQKSEGRVCSYSTGVVNLRQGKTANTSKHLLSRRRF